MSILAEPLHASTLSSLHLETPFLIASFLFRRHRVKILRCHLWQPIACRRLRLGLRLKLRGFVIWWTSLLLRKLRIGDLNDIVIVVDTLTTFLRGLRYRCLRSRTAWLWWLPDWLRIWLSYFLGRWRLCPLLSRLSLLVLDAWGRLYLVVLVWLYRSLCLLAVGLLLHSKLMLSRSVLL